MKFIETCRSCSSRACTSTPSIVAPFVVDRIFNMKPEQTVSLYGVPNQVNYFPSRTLNCKTCGFVGVNIMFDDEEMACLYRGYRDDAYNTLRRSYEPGYKSDVFESRHAYVDEVSEPFIRAMLPREVHTLIDFGGYDGLNTPRIGMERYVYDICDVQPIVPKTDSLFPCDIMTCMHVLEHAPDPNRILEEMKGYARYYYFEVPNEVVGVDRKAFWHEHINCFTMHSLEHVLARHFKIIGSKEDMFLHVLCENIG